MYTFLHSKNTLLGKQNGSEYYRISPNKPFGKNLAEKQDFDLLVNFRVNTGSTVQ